jgi:hypothetical protein
LSFFFSYDQTNEEESQVNASSSTQSLLTTKIEGVRKRFVRSSPSTPVNGQNPSSSASFLLSRTSDSNLLSPNEPSMPGANQSAAAVYESEDTKFQATIDFVRTYLDNVVQQSSPFGDKEQNKLTFEVGCVLLFYYSGFL